MSHHPYYATAPLGQVASPVPSPLVATEASAPSATMTAYRVASVAAGAALAFHGYKRTGSVGWALAWALGGGLVWPVGLGIAFAQGFGKPAIRSNRRSRR